MPTAMIRHSPRRGGAIGAIGLTLVVLISVTLAIAHACTAIYKAGYRNGQIDAFSGTLIKFEQVTLKNGSTGWVNSAEPEKVYRIDG